MIAHQCVVAIRLADDKIVDADDAAGSLQLSYVRSRHGDSNHGQGLADLVELTRSFFKKRKIDK